MFLWGRVSFLDLFNVEERGRGKREARPSFFCRGGRGRGYILSGVKTETYFCCAGGKGDFL